MQHSKSTARWLHLPAALALTATLALSAPASGADFVLHSSTVAPNATLQPAQVYKGFGCSGENVSPALSWQGAPAGTKSFAITVYDPDAPTGSGWWHWVVYNIPATVNALPAGAGSGGVLPAGAVQGRTDFGTPGYGGPCPPAGDKPHHYHFTVYALKVEKLDVPAEATAALIGFTIHANQLARTGFVALYGR